MSLYAAPGVNIDFFLTNINGGELTDLVLCRWDGLGRAPPTGPEDVPEQAGVCRPFRHQAALYLPAALPGHRQGEGPPLR